MIGLNDYISAERTNRFKAAKIKADMETQVHAGLKDAAKKGTLHSHKEPCELWICFVEPNRRRDLDNISFATKAIQDAMVKVGVFPDDSAKFIQLLHYTVAYDPEDPRIVITIRERGNHE
jgi:Holliday junction resolvase RusA-like endonuclease